MPNPFRVTVYDKAFAFQGYVGNPTSLTVTPRHNQQGTGSLTIDADHRMASALSAKGARVLVEHKPAGGSWEFLMSGKVTLVSGQGPSKVATITYQFADDARILANVLGWPVPSSPYTNQTASEYDTRTGAAETVLKGFVTANIVNRLAMPVTVATDQGRGATIPGGVALRMQPLAEKLLPAIDAAGIGVSVQQSGAGLVLDVYVPRTYPHTLSEKGGTITAWSYSDAVPTSSRAISGGQGDGTARVFGSYVDSTLESDYGDVVETYVDATNTAAQADLNGAAQQDVTKGAPLSGFSVTLSQTGQFQYGQNGVRVGDQVTVDIGGVTRTDVLRECTLAYSREQGETQTPVIGAINPTADRVLAKFLEKLRASINTNRR
jgi:hypothetical protein